LVFIVTRLYEYQSPAVAFRHVKLAVNSEEFFRNMMCRKVFRKSKGYVSYAATKERPTGI